MEFWNNGQLQVLLKVSLTIIRKHDPTRIVLLKMHIVSCIHIKYMYTYVCGDFNNNKIYNMLYNCQHISEEKRGEEYFASNNTYTLYIFT